MGEVWLTAPVTEPWAQKPANGDEHRALGSQEMWECCWLWVIYLLPFYLISINGGGGKLSVNLLQICTFLKVVCAAKRTYTTLLADNDDTRQIDNLAWLLAMLLMNTEPGASIHMGQGGHVPRDTSPQYLDWGDIITNVPLNISRVISANFYPCNIFLISWKSF